MASKVNMVLTDIDKIGTADAATNDTFIDVVGNKTDVANRTTGQASIVGLLRQLDTDVSTIASSLGAIGVTTGTSDSGTTGTLVDAALTQDNDYFNGMILIMTSGDNIGLASTIVDFDAASDTITIEPDFPSAIGTDTYAILPRSDWSDVLIGNNNNDNAADTSNVVANIDGSVLERLEHVKDQLISGGDIYDVLYTDAAGASITADIASLTSDVSTIDAVVDETNEYLEAGGAVHDALVTDAAGANVAADIITIDGIVDTITAENSSNDSSGTFSYLDAGGEQDVVEITNSTRKIINAIWVDCTNLTNNGQFKVYYKIDGTNYREVNDLTNTITGGTTEALNLLAGNMGITEDVKVTYTEAGDEGAAKDIPYSVVYETKE